MNEFIEKNIWKQIWMQWKKYWLKFEDYEDVFQDICLRLLRKKKKNVDFEERYNKIYTNINNDKRFEDEEFKKACWYVSITIVRQTQRAIQKKIWLLQSEYEEDEETWEDVLVESEFSDRIKIKEVEIKHDIDDNEWFDFDKNIYLKNEINYNIDLNIFYQEIQKYTNILLCLLTEDEINMIKQNKNNNTKYKFLKMFLNLMINIDEEKKGLTLEETIDFWQDALEAVSKKKNKQREHFIKTRMFLNFKDIVESR